MNDQPLVSIIVPVYNVERYLAECLESLRAQTYRNIEIVCVNDGSPDRSRLLLGMFAGLDSRIVAVEQDNKGLPGARNTGIGASHGDIVMFVDSDDALAPGACKTVVQAFVDNDPADMVVFGTSFIGQGRGVDPWLAENLDVRDAVYDEFCLDVLFSEHAQPFVWRNAFSREFLDRNGLRFEEDIKFGEDKVFQFTAFPRTRRSVLVSDKIYRYRVSRTGSLMDAAGKTRAVKIGKHVGIVDRICQRWTESGDMDKYAPELFKWTLDFMGYDTLSLESRDQADICAKMAAVWDKWFPANIASTAGLGKGYMQRYEWMRGVYSVEQRADIRARNDKNARAIELEGLDGAATLKRAAKAPLRKVWHALRHVLPSPASSSSQYFDEVHGRLDRIAEESNDSSVETLLLFLEMRAREGEGGNDHIE